MTKFIAAAIHIREAAARGARLVVLPETMNYIGRDIAGEAEPIPLGPTFQKMAGLARELGITRQTLLNKLSKYGLL